MKESDSTLPTVSRQHDLDWLRVLVILVVFVFHCGRFFDTEGWHLKNPQRHEAVKVWTVFLASWMMPLIFVISGASIFHSLRRRSNAVFLKERAFRLLVPLVVGIFTHVAVQVYIERITNHRFSGSFWKFYPHYFEGWYPRGNFAWMGLHLWYLEALFLFSLLALPLFRWIQKESSRAVLSRLENVLQNQIALYAMAIPLALVFACIDPNTFLGQRGFGGWSLLAYPFFFIYGFLLTGMEKAGETIARHWHGFFLAAFSSTILVIAVWKNRGDPRYPGPYYAWLHAGYAFSSWCWILGILGAARTYLNFDKPLLKRANEAVLPFYVLHQSVIIVVGYFIVFRPFPDIAKFLLIAAVSFSLIRVFYGGLIRSNQWGRFLFGMN